MNIGLEKINVFYDGKESPFEPGKVIVEPLGRGFGTTLGVSLRRIMLGYMPGSSVIGIKIPGVLHEFTTVPGTATDVTSLIKNLKKIRFNVLDVEDTEVKTIHFKHNKKGFVTAGELALPAGIEVQNPEQNLINLLGSEEVEFEIYVKRGRGYVDAKLHKEFEGRPDIIKVDGTFSPVKLVGYEVENMRLGQDATYERLILNVTTDGSINAKDATLVAAKIAYDHFSFFEGISDIATKTEIYQEKMEEEENHILDQPIEILDLSVRSFNCLKREKRLFIRDIIALTEMELYNIHQLGDKSVKEIIVKIKELGLEMKAE